MFLDYTILKGNSDAQGIIFYNDLVVYEFKLGTL